MLGQYVFNTMVNAIGHHSHSQSIHSQSTVNAIDNGQTMKNNPQMTTNNTKR
jgi:hypothetical protein